jgi:hypothetical protein
MHGQTNTLLQFPLNKIKLKKRSHQSKGAYGKTMNMISIHTKMAQQDMLPIIGCCSHSCLFAQSKQDLLSVGVFCVFTIENPSLM